jgi:hypothetical protein
MAGTVSARERARVRRRWASPSRRRAASGQELGQGSLVIVSGVTADRLSEKQVHAWVAQSCADQGLPLLITDVLVLERVRVLLTGTASARGPHTLGSLSAPPSEPPDRLHAVRVQRARTEDAETDHGADDRRVPGQVQPVPRTA